MKITAVMRAILLSVIVSAPDAGAADNFYDNVETRVLGSTKIEIAGEVVNPGPAAFAALPERSVIAAETALDAEGKEKYSGAYRYDGYSLFDILSYSLPDKKNKAEFPPITDLYVEVENEAGEKSVFSWGEIYYPDNPHRIMIATSISRPVSSNTRAPWDLPGKAKLVAADDRLAERNLPDPVRITVRSYPITLKVEKGLSPMFSPGVKVFSGADKVAELADFPEGLDTNTVNKVFYGQGKGAAPFTGVALKDILKPYYPSTRANLRSGLLCFAAKDGYRSVVSYSELFNRGDRQEFLMIKTAPEEDGGLFKLFPAPDLFADRAVRSITEIHLGY